MRHCVAFICGIFLYNSELWSITEGKGNAIGENVSHVLLRCSPVVVTVMMKRYGR